MCLARGDDLRERGCPCNRLALAFVAKLLGDCRSLFVYMLQALVSFPCNRLCLGRTTRPFIIATLGVFSLRVRYI